jgi:hypothetical protein
MNDALIGTPCDDGDVCTTGETFDNNCNCSGGIFQDDDNDGICNAEDQCPSIDDSLIGSACDDGDDCMNGETFDANCNCTGGVFEDADNDGVCNANDQCPGVDDALIGQACDDGDECTVGEAYDSNCNCSGGSLLDNNNNGICDIVESGCDILQIDNFEADEGDWLFGGDDAARVMSSLSPQGDYSIRIRDNSGTASSAFTPVMDYSTVDTLKVGFNFRANSMEIGESFSLEGSIDGGTTFTMIQEWVSGTDFNNNEIYYEQVSILSNLLSYHIRSL